MKTAFYIEDGLTQIVLTPETEFESEIVAKIKNGIVKIYRGSFYECQGGWVKQGSDDKSVILVLREEDK